MKFREATLNDAEVIAKLHLDSWRKNYCNDLSKEYLEYFAQAERYQLWNQRLRTPKENQRVILAEDRGSIVGFACIYIDENEKWGSYLDNFHIAEAYQNKGIGTTLLGQVFKRCKIEAKKTGLCLLVNQSNKKAQNFYLKNGANNQETGIWNAPDGSSVPTFWFTWSSINGYQENQHRVRVGVLLRRFGSV